jgi:hypothetical protein
MRIERFRRREVNWLTTRQTNAARGYGERVCDPTCARLGQRCAIFQVLEAQGFHGRSCTAPGRLIPEMQAIWIGGQPDPHRASAVFRQALGALDFANMPLSADFSRPLAGPAGRSMFADFRPDVDWPGQYDVSYRTIATNIVAQVRERAPRVPVLNDRRPQRQERHSSRARGRLGPTCAGGSERSEASCRRLVEDPGVL